jgi:hypothetical protein
VNRGWRIFVAVFVFLLVVLVGSAGGCVVAFSVAFQRDQTLFYVLWGAGTLIGAGVGILVGREILKPPRE